MHRAGRALEVTKPSARKEVYREVMWALPPREKSDAGKHRAYSVPRDLSS